MDKTLRIIGLKKVYHDLNSEVEAIKDISLEINNNEFVSIVGPSGCGKSSLLSILAGIESKSSGEVVFDKENIKLGYMLQ